MTQPRLRIASTVINAPDPRELAGFYQRLMGWEIVDDEPDWVKLQPAGGGTALAFQSDPEFTRPVWPPRPEEQQMLLHLDIAAEDLEAAVAWAIQSGAVVADHQPGDESTVMLDPVGNPFCLFKDPT